MPIAKGWYCDKDDVRDLTGIDSIASEDRQVEKIIGMAQAEIEATLKAAGFPTEDWTTNALTPNKIQVLCCKLASGFLLRVQYTGESPNESKQAAIWVNSARKQLDRIAMGEELIIDTGGELVIVDTDVSGETLKTTDTKAVFDLDDVGDMEDVVDGGVYQEEAED